MFPALSTRTSCSNPTPWIPLMVGLPNVGLPWAVACGAAVWPRVTSRRIRDTDASRRAGTRHLFPDEPVRTSRTLLLRGSLHRHRRGRRAAEHGHAVELLFLVLRLDPASDAEKAFSVHEPDEDREVHDERGHTEHRDPLRQLVDLEREEPRRRDSGEVLGPSLLEPQP